MEDKDEQELERAQNYRRKFWFQMLKTPSVWLSVSNFVLIATIALCIGVFIAWLNPEILMLAAPVLVGTAMVALSIGAAVFPFFAAWKMYEHYNAWRFRVFVGNTLGKRSLGICPNPPQGVHFYNQTYSNYLRVHSEESWSEYNDQAEKIYEQTLEANRTNPAETVWRLPKIGYGYYILSLWGEFKAWVNYHKAQVVLVAVGLGVSAVMIGIGIGFFLGDGFSMSLLSPMLDLVNKVLSVGFMGLSELSGLGGLALFTSYMGQIVGVVLTAALPLIIMDNIRRFAQSIWEGQQAGGGPLWMGSKIGGFNYPLDATEPERNSDLGAREAAWSFWAKVYKDVSDALETTDNNVVGSKYQQLRVD